MIPISASEQDQGEEALERPSVLVADLTPTVLLHPLGCGRTPTLHLYLARPMPASVRLVCRNTCARPKLQSALGASVTGYESRAGRTRAWRPPRRTSVVCTLYVAPRVVARKPQLCPGTWCHRGARPGSLQRLASTRTVTAEPEIAELYNWTKLICKSRRLCEVNRVSPVRKERRPLVAVKQIRKILPRNK